MYNQKRVTKSLALLAVALVTTGCSKSPENYADHQFINACAYTLDEAQSWADTVHVTGNKITYVGDRAGGEAHVGPQTTTHHLGGNMLLPGFIDTHMHPTTEGAYAKALSLDTFGIIDDWVAAFSEWLRVSRLRFWP